MIYLDNCASSFPKPKEVAKAMTRAINVFGANPGRSGHFLSLYAANEVYNCREIVGQLFNLPPERVIFTLNATMAINIALKGALLEGNEVIVSDFEHNAIIRPLKALEKIGVTYKQACVDLYDDSKTIKAFEQQITNKTRMLACTHCSNVLGKVVPIKQLGELAKKRGLLFLVDAAQTAGSINIDVNENNIDYLCLAGHKGLYGPQGIGALLINNVQLLSTIIEGGTGVNSKQLVQPMEMPERYESGTINTPGIVGLKEGMKFINKIGLNNILEYEKNLILFAYDELKNINKVRLYTNRPNEGFANVLPFNIEGFHSNEVAEYLDNNFLMTRSGYHCAPTAHKKLNTLESGTVRISVSIFNTKKDIEKLLLLVKKFIKSK